MHASVSGNFLKFNRQLCLILVYGFTAENVGDGTASRRQFAKAPAEHQNKVCISKASTIC